MPVGERSESSFHLSVGLRKGFYAWIFFVHLPEVYASVSELNIDSSEDCFRSFGNGKQFLNKENFCELTLFVLKVNDSWCGESAFSDLFSRFDRNIDSKIDSGEFEIVWRYWINPLMKPVTALIVVDVQNDFIDGSLAMRNCPAKEEGKEVVPVINKLIENVNFDFVVYSIDYHPPNHISFFDNLHLYKLSDNSTKKPEDIKQFDVVTFAGPPEMNQTLWPRHCVQGTWGCELNPELEVIKDGIFIHKGTNPKIDSYSAFFDNGKTSSTTLHSELQKRQVTHVFVTGLAYDYCVAFTALDALELGYATVLIEDAARGTDIDNIKRMNEKLISNLCVIAQSDEVEDFVKGGKTCVEFAEVLGSKQIQI